MKKDTGINNMEDYVNQEDINKIIIQPFLNEQNCYFLHLNIRSLNKNYDQLLILLKDINYDMDIIALTEIWNINIESYKGLLKGYKQYYKKPKQKIGGVCIYIKENIELEVLNNKEFEGIEQIWAKIEIDNKFI